MKVIHLIPQDGLGGVEQAARSLRSNNQFYSEVVYLVGNYDDNNLSSQSVSKNKKLNSISIYTNGLKYLKKKNPDLLVCSLWRSSLVGVIYTIYRRAICNSNFKFVLIIHASRYSHLIDMLITKIAMKLANEVWFDSHASKKAILKSKKYNSKTRVLSFLVKTHIPPTYNKNKLNNFVFWGRLARVKRVDRSIKLFSEIKKELPESVFYIYGPDGGELSALKELSRILNIEDSVFFMGPKPPNEYPEPILKAKFFMNASEKEGMAIAVTEAMQLGLVPIVTPVGEISNYCQDRINSIYLNNESCQIIVECAQNDVFYKKLQHNAFTYWNRIKDYSDDFNNNCLRILNYNNKY